jgi:hypothetical protein
MKKNFLLLACLLLSLNIQAQSSYKFDADEFPGEIILKKGNRVGYVDMKGSDMSPWKNQNSVRFFTEEAIADGKLKRKEKEKLKPKDAKGYIADGRYFESMKISAAKLNIGVGMASYKFVERMVDGHVKMYKFYESPDPTAVHVGEEAIAAAKVELERMRNNPMLVIKKGDEKLVLLRKVNIGELLADCDEVQQKYLSGGYGVEPFNQDAETKLGKFISKNANAEQMEAILPEILKDYNKCMSK